MYLSIADDWHIRYIAIISKRQDLVCLQEKVKSMLPGIGGKGKKSKKRKRKKKKIIAAISLHTEFKIHFFKKGISHPRARSSFTFFWTVSSAKLNVGIIHSYTDYGFVLYCDQLMLWMERVTEKRKENGGFPVCMTGISRSNWWYTQELVVCQC